MSSNLLAHTHVPSWHVLDQFLVLTVFIFKAAQNMSLLDCPKVCATL